MDAHASDRKTHPTDADVTAYLACEHLTTLSLRAARGEIVGELHTGYGDRLDVLAALYVSAFSKQPLDHVSGAPDLRVIPALQEIAVDVARAQHAVLGTADRQHVALERRAGITAVARIDDDERRSTGPLFGERIEEAPDQGGSEVFASRAALQSADRFSF